VDVGDIAGVSEILTQFTHFGPEDGGSTYLWNANNITLNVPPLMSETKFHTLTTSLNKLQINKMDPNIRSITYEHFRGGCGLWRNDNYSRRCWCGDDSLAQLSGNIGCFQWRFNRASARLELSFLSITNIPLITFPPEDLPKFICTLKSLHVLFESDTCTLFAFPT
jgi:hypothetical protein